MIDFEDKIIDEPNKKIITHEDGSTEEVTIVDKNAPTVSGTPINRANLMAIQGFIPKTTTFNEDGSVTQTNSLGQTLTITFSPDGGITQTFSGEKDISQTITINDSGDIIEEIN